MRVVDNAQRGPHIVRDRKLESLAHHADDGDVVGAQLHGPAEDRGVTSEPRLPDVVSDDRDVRTPRRVQDGCRAERARDDRMVVALDVELYRDGLHGSGADEDVPLEARRVVEQAIGEKLDGSPLDDPNDGKNPSAVALGRLGGAGSKVDLDVACIFDPFGNAVHTALHDNLVRAVDMPRIPVAMLRIAGEQPEVVKQAAELLRTNHQPSEIFPLFPDELKAAGKKQRARPISPVS